MSELPSGTVTFLFTDIEGSTKLLYELGDAYAEALAEHRRILREAFARHDGIEFGTEGDAFFVVFVRADDAVSAAAEGQKALRGGPISVRMGLHTGEPLLTEEGYVGIDVHRAARIASAGHGGQILVSLATRKLLDSTVELSDLGEHQLKDLTSPERIYQLGHDEHPPVKSLNQTNLPVQPTPLIGRERELAGVLELLRSHRLVTLTGPGGSGKTRLALQAVAELVGDFPDGVWFVSLAPLHDPELVESTIAETLGIADGETLPEHLERKEALLLLDNFEQLLEAAPRLAELLQRAPNVKLVVTSRARLHLAGEHEYPVPPLADEDAVALFVERVRTAKPSFEPDEHVGAICRQLDNLPLAVELAAARTKVLVPEQLLERLERRLPLLSGGARDAPERQRTLRATIDWSYDLLAEEEKELFRRLAVFAGSFDLDAAEEVCDADVDTLASLIDKSLLRQTAEGRFFMLATIREYAAERFYEDPAADPVRRRHADRTLRVAEEASAMHRNGFDALEAEQDNARAALDFLAAAGEAELALRLVIAFGVFWLVRGHAREGRRRIDAALADAPGAPAKLRLAALIHAATLARVVGDGDAAERPASEAVATARELGDDAGLATALRELGEAVMVARHDYARAFALYEESLAIARAAGEPIVATVTNLADVALAAGELESAIDYSAQAAELATTGHDAETVRAIAAFNTASALIQLGREAEARPHLGSALETVVRIDFMELVGWCLVATAALAEPSDPAAAASLLGAADGAVASAGVTFGPAEQRLRDWILSKLEERCEPRDLEASMLSGRALPMDDAVSLAQRYLD
jgi:predicted ATPase/class 3 adenylate cyclase